MSAGGEETGISVTALEGNTDFVLVWIIRMLRSRVLTHDT